MFTRRLRPSGAALAVVLLLLTPATATTQGGKNWDATRKRALEPIPPAGSDTPFSARPDVDTAMREGEAAFSRGDYDAALAAYTRALSLDPKLYEAALFAGDTFFARKQWDKAIEWFARAAAIDPGRETALRYWADALLEKGKVEEAHAKYVDAIIAEPYRREGWLGLTEWAKAAKVTLAHPEIEPTSGVRKESSGNVTITIDPKALKDKGDYWLFYGLARAAWPKERFAKEYPKEKVYRHSLREEVSAFTMVVEMVSNDLKSGKVKREALDPSIANLLRVHEAGLLEPFILYGRPDEGIVQDYEAYRATNREKLRRYLAELIVVRGR